MKMRTIKWIIVLCFVGVIFINALANGLPLAGRTTGEISELYPNLFTPAGFTFSIWGVIYAGLLASVIRVLTIKKSDELVVIRIAPWWVLNFIANMGWILSWHYLQLKTSMIVMILLLYSLIQMSSKLAQTGHKSSDLKLLRVVFDTYFGWITVATVANFTALLVGLEWDGFGFSAEAWMIVVLFVILAIVSSTYYRGTSVFYLMPVLWAFYGIYSKHIDPDEFNGAYPAVISSIKIALLLIVLTAIVRFGMKFFQSKNV